MSTYFSDDLRDGIEASLRAQRKDAGRLRVMVGEDVYPVHRVWTNGFAMDARDAPHLRGRVDLFDGARHLYQCLIVTSREEAGERCYEFKRRVAARSGPALDFVRDADAPIALIEN